MAKFDVEAAYRNIPVHPSDRVLLDIKWRGKYYVDLALPFGLWSAPYIFTLVADMVEWILKNSHKVPDLLHYLDDFITAGTWDSPICSHYLMTAKEACSRLGLPLHPLKCGLLPSWLSWALELGSNQQVARLPAEKLAATCEQVNQWRARKWCNRLQLKSLIAHLQHAAKEVWPGRTFLRRTIDLSCCF